MNAPPIDTCTAYFAGLSILAGILIAAGPESRLGTNAWLITMPNTMFAGSARIHAPIDIERSAGNEAVVLAGEEDGGTRNIIGIASATDRYAGDHQQSRVQGQILSYELVYRFF